VTRMFGSLSLLVFLALPFIEIAGFVIVGQEIGVLATLGLVILSAVLGFALLRRQGLSLLNQMKAEAASGRVPQREIIHGTLLMFAGILLIIPGFVTDIIGLLLFVPFIRDLIWNRFMRNRIVMTGNFHSTHTSSGSYGGAGGYKQDDDIIDLDPEDYSAADKEKNNPNNSPWIKDQRD
jgi:UPF0716 protein FxsA